MWLCNVQPSSIIHKTTPFINLYICQRTNTFSTGITTSDFNSFTFIVHVLEHLQRVYLFVRHTRPPQREHHRAPRLSCAGHQSTDHFTLHLTHARGHFILSLEPRIPCPCKKIIINNVITITIIINYNYFCPPEALHRPRTPCLRSSAAAALPRGPRPRLQF